MSNISLNLSIEEVNKVLVAIQTTATDNMLLAQKIKSQGEAQTTSSPDEPVAGIATEDGDAILQEAGNK